MGVAADLEAFDPVRLQAMRLRDAQNGHLGDAQAPSQSARTPVRARGRFLLGRDLDHALHKLRRQARLAPRPSSVLERFQATLDPASAPQQHGLTVGIQCLGYGVIRHPCSSHQDDAGAQHQLLRRAPPEYPLIQDGALLVGHLQRLCRLPHEQSLARFHAIVHLYKWHMTSRIASISDHGPSEGSSAASQGSGAKVLEVDLCSKLNDSRVPDGLSYGTEIARCHVSVGVGEMRRIRQIEKFEPEL